ncbi:ABC transporter permease [Corynebacterium pseudodiphtheriticum]|uniref:ABC transporter permease n=1 Tax=Corynebacterium pseudodiphtheriticum TaxID=37637 RepID=UPI000F888D04|nr:ABC transporter permease [Corynebacterium pseudodiphtheriticum]MDK4304360.1 ABC transporter permease [Corynebacterium pseudodiphtheriticum]MDK8684585.1 ABC transporter permease [Corynebacterium pseudodiphtheriticum]MDK8709907.1 ABC transporter permease [Corynebacterium pseudodiphtheriticum]MDK8805478.1 ABC transporter permease [Corynebacterium pseudodiphtheriticum]RUP90901.1 ABC transporter permease [Corynebacterium pseudodiphtheriticum]
MSRTHTPTTQTSTGRTSASRTSTSQASTGRTSTGRTLPREKSGPWKPVALGVGLFLAFLLVWQLIAAAGWLSDIAPTPARTFSRGAEILADPFYRDGPASVGIFWHMVTSLRRVLLGFIIAMLIAIPLGFWLGSSTTFRRATDPFVQILRPVSPLAWLPLGLALLRDAENTAVFVIILSALWPTLLNTIEAVRGVHPSYKNLGATLGTSRVDRLLYITGPAALPGIITGMRQSLSTAWLVIVAAEMLVGGQGVGFFVWNMWNRLDIDAIVVVIVLIGAIGLALDYLVASLQKVVRYD